MILDPIAVCQMNIVHKSCEWNSIARKGRMITVGLGTEDHQLPKFCVSDFCMPNRKECLMLGTQVQGPFLNFVFLVEVEEPYLIYSPFLQAH